MKKLVALILSAILVLSLVPTVAFAEGEDLQIEIGSVTANVAEGTEFKVPVNLVANKGYASGIMTLKWDSAIYELTNIEFNDEVAKANAQAAIKNTGAQKVSFGDDMVTENFTKTGLMFTLTFKVLAGAEKGGYSVFFDDFDVYDCNIKKVIVTSNNAGITLDDVTEQPTTEAQETTAPVQETTAPVQPTTEVQETTAPVQPTESQETTAPVQPTESQETTAAPATTAPVKPTTVAPVPAAKKKANPMKVTVKKTVKVKVKKLKKKAQKVKGVVKISGAKGKVTIKISKAKKAIKKYLKITTKGVLNIKKWKKAKKGTYKITVKVTAKGNKQFKKKTVSKIIKVMIK